MSDDLPKAATGSDPASPAPAAGEKRRPFQGLGARLARLSAAAARALLAFSRLVFKHARQRSGDAVQDFKDRPEHARWRAYALSSYGLICAATFAVQLYEPNSLNAYVKVQPVAMPDATVIFVRNDSPKIWKNVRITLNGIYGYERNELTPGSHVLVKVDRFAVFDPNGKASYAPKDIAPKQLVIDCDRGHFEKELAP